MSFSPIKGKDYCGYWASEKKYPGANWFIAHIPYGHLGKDKYEIVYVCYNDPVEELKIAKIFDGKTLLELWDELRNYEMVIN